MPPEKMSSIPRARNRKSKSVPTIRPLNGISVCRRNRNPSRPAAKTVPATMRLETTIMINRARELPTTSDPALRATVQRRRWKSQGCETGVWVTTLMDNRARSGGRRFGLLLFLLGQLQKHILQRPLVVGLFPQGVERAATDQPAVMHDADPVGQLLG